MLAQNEAQLAAQDIPTVHKTVNTSAFIAAGLGMQEHQATILCMKSSPASTRYVEELMRREGPVVDEGDEDKMDGAEMDGAETGNKEEYIEEVKGQNEYLWDN
ncbi:hypothetical protein PILCRDRAFT_12527 [Piloderma croceum F 1598]|uniref:Uncharacterized protein n=1 Tax=Piloderma croceum (strain F 1598) TaxID=765440 RepID=A0A0C3FA87_PILCF|nr:hypothetical protein PILCRDRAFT_12527 [Piloderma croceum F 1598]